MRTITPVVSRLPARVLECLVRGYQVVLSPLLVGSCKFVPSCSDYFIQAVREWDVIRGTWLGIRRLARCHPFGPGGIDPVPRRPASCQGQELIATRSPVCLSQRNIEEPAGLKPAAH